MIVSQLVPVRPASGLSNDLFKGPSGRTGGTDERAKDDICLSQKLIISIEHVTVSMSNLLTAFFPPLTSSNNVL